ncbi:hypothetical protein H5410_060953 [Solanum commersonii]|uniref:Uncharacterized protein n=1 Tax=Solanum commersonii TaxID=4109 RepID=A0A9J5W6E6_SOLCO|nr:hypothetical protein H5410_060953 [Solanum commersonii]
MAAAIDSSHKINQTIKKELKIRIQKIRIQWRHELIINHRSPINPLSITLRINKKFQTGLRLMLRVRKIQDNNDNILGRQDLITLTSKTKKRINQALQVITVSRMGKIMIRLLPTTNQKLNQARKREKQLKEDSKKRLRYNIPKYRKDRFLETRTSSNRMTTQTTSKQSLTSTSDNKLTHKNTTKSLTFEEI